MSPAAHTFGSFGLWPGAAGAVGRARIWELHYVMSVSPQPLFLQHLREAFGWCLECEA